jgi:hypothetical protein
MLHILLAMGAPAIFAAIVVFAARMSRRKECPNFSRWMETEGVPIFAGVWFTFMMAFLLAR